MKFIIILLLLLILSFFIFVLFQAIKNSFWYRTRQVFKNTKKRKKQEQEILEKYTDHTTEEEKRQMIHEFRKKGNIKIPYAAFDYIYRHIDEFGIVSKDGKIILTDEESYKKIIDKTNNMNINFHKENKKNKLNQKTYFDVQEGENGSISTRDFINKTITLETSNKDVYIANGRNMVIFKNPENEEKDKNKKNSSKEKTFSKNQQNKNFSNADKKDDNNELSSDKKDKYTMNKLLEKKALAKLKEEQNKKDSITVDNSNIDINNIDIDEIVKEMDNKEIPKPIETDNNKEIPKPIEIKPTTEEENDEEEEKIVERSFDQSFTINNFFQRKIYFNNNLDSFCGSLNNEIIKDFIINFFTFVEKYYSYPTIIKDDKTVYIDSALLIITLSKIIVKDDEADFLNKMFSKKGSYLINLQNSIYLFKAINNILNINLFKIWKNQDNQDVCMIKKSFSYNYKNYSSLFFLIDIQALKILKIDTNTLIQVELKDKIAGAFLITKAIVKEN